MNNADWWAKKLGQQPEISIGRPDPTPPMPPSQQPMSQMPAFQQPQTTKAESSRQTTTCPDCGSSNYFSFQNSAPRCYECGYPVQQSGSRYGSLAGARIEGATKQATGNDATNNYNPQGIIGSING